MVIAYEDYPWKNPLKIYWASVTGSRKIESEQLRLKQIIGGERLVVEWIDITVAPNLLREMRRLCGDEHALPPQIFNGHDHLGDVTKLNFSIEEGELWQFLKLNRKTAVRYKELPDGGYEILEPPPEPEEPEEEDILPQRMPVFINRDGAINDHLRTPKKGTKLAGGVKMPCMSPAISSRKAFIHYASLLTQDHDVLENGVK